MWIMWYNMRMRNLVIVFNNPTKEERHLAEVEKLKQWFGTRVPFLVSIRYEYFKDIPFSPYPHHTQDLFGIDPEWYKKHITPLSRGGDIILFVVPMAQWKGQRARGWRADRNEYGCVETHIGADEGEHIYENGKDMGSTFFQYGRHEIMHALFMLQNKPDTTHKHWDAGNLDGALAELADETPKTADVPAGIVAQLLAVIAGLRKRVEELTREQVPKRETVVSVSVRDFAMAIQRKEGWYPGSRSYRNNNPGNVKYVGQRNAIGKDPQGFAVFKSYKDGFDYLCWMIANAKAGKSKIYTPDMTIEDFFKVFAPSGDKNDPMKYARDVREWTGAGTNYKIKDLI